MFEILVLFIFGLGIGSFLNVLIYRLNDEKAPKFWQGRSVCPRCKHVLAWRDNIPLVSFVLLGGRCRYCRRKISLQYPVVELTTAVTFASVWLLSPTELGVLGRLSLLGIASCFIVIFFSDWIYGLIPDEMVLAAVFLSVIFRMGQIGLVGQILRDVVVGLLSSLAFLAVVVATKFRGMGLGDVKLAFVMGFLLGFPKVLVAFWVAFIFGGFFALVLLLLKKKKFRDTMALGPFLVVGVLISALWSDQLLHLIGL